MLGRLLITMFALWFTAWLLPGMAISGPIAGLFAALILGVVNTLIKPIFTVLTLPLTILTLGLFLFVVNGLMLLITAFFVPGFTVSGLMTAIFGSLLLSVVGSLVGSNVS